MNKKKSLTILAVVVVVIVLIWFNTKSTGESLMLEPKASDNQNGQVLTGNQPVDTLEGTLRVSNNSSKGNLMLMADESVIYITTSRDFSSLLGKNVVVSVDGTLENFTLLNIEENL